LLAPRLNEKWHKLVIHRIPIDIFPNSLEGIMLLQQEIEHNNNVKLAQTPRYISHPEKQEGKATSSVMIALKVAEDAHTLKRTRVIVLYDYK
jgi:hypothetical protein